MADPDVAAAVAAAAVDGEAKAACVVVEVEAGSQVYSSYLYISIFSYLTEEKHPFDSLQE